MKYLNTIAQRISLFFTILLFYSCPIAQAQWVYLGDPEISGLGTATMDVWQGVPYVAYNDEAAQGKGTVMKYDGTNWVSVGIPGFTPDKAYGFSLKMNDSIPYVAFIDYSFAVGNEKGKLTVMKYESGAWTFVGTPGFSPGIVRRIALAIGGGIPYVAFWNYGQAWIMRFDGAGWTQVGPVIETYARDLSLAIHSETPYVAYQQGNGYHSIVKKFDGTDWVDIGDTGFDGHSYSTMSFAMSGSGTPYLTHDNVSPGEYGGIIKFDGNAWVNIEAPNIIQEILQYRPIALDGEIPYVVFQYPYLGLTVMRYKNGAWEMVGATITVAGPSEEFLPDFVNILLENGVPYLGFQHELSTGGGPATVMKYLEASSSNDLPAQKKTGFRLYPNPSHGGEITFYLENAVSDDALLQVFNLNGKQFFEQKIALEAGKSAYSVRLPDLPTGVYLTKLTTSGNQMTSRKLVIMH